MWQRMMVMKCSGSGWRSSLQLRCHDLHPPRLSPRRLVEPHSYLQRQRSDWLQRHLGWGWMQFGSWVASGRVDTSPGHRAISSDSQRGRNDCTAWSRHCSCPLRKKHRHTCSSEVDLEQCFSIIFCSFPPSEENMYFAAPVFHCSRIKVQCTTVYDVRWDDCWFDMFSLNIYFSSFRFVYKPTVITYSWALHMPCHASWS